MIESILPEGNPWVLLPLALKSTLILGVALAGAVLLKRSQASAAARHLNWLAAMLALLTLPPLSLTLPKLDVALLPESRVEDGWTTSAPPVFSDGHSRLVATARADTPPGMRVGSETHPLRSMTGSGIAAVEPLPGEQAAPSGYLLGWLYLAVLACLLIRLVLARLALFILHRNTQELADSDWQSLLRRLTADLSLHRHVRLLTSPTCVMPMTWGTLRPTILLPKEALLWTEERRRFVLLHELGHVQRHDTATQNAAQLACAIFWFNPLAWYGAAQLRKEQEHACDALVLKVMRRPEAYARNLLDIAISREPRALAQRLSVAMASRSDLEERLLAIAGGSWKRHQPGRSIAAGAGAGLTCLTCLVAALNPVPVDAKAPAASIPRFGATEKPPHFSAVAKAEASAGSDAASTENIRSRGEWRESGLETVRAGSPSLAQTFSSQPAGAPNPQPVGRQDSVINDRLIVRGNQVIRRPSTAAERHADEIMLAAEEQQEAAERTREGPTRAREAAEARNEAEEREREAPDRARDSG